MFLPADFRRQGISHGAPLARSRSSSAIRQEILPACGFPSSGNFSRCSAGSAQSKSRSASRPVLFLPADFRRQEISRQKAAEHRKVFKLLSQRSTARFLSCWARGPQKIHIIRIGAPLSRQPLVKGERLIRCEVSAAIPPPELSDTHLNLYL